MVEHVAPVLAARRVTVRFGGVVAVDAVDLDVGPGEVVGIIGPNGAGKTTLLDAVCGFVPLAGGSVRLDGRDVTSTLPWRRARLGLARSFQQPRLFPSMTVRETLAGALHPSFPAGLLAEVLGLPAAREAEERATTDVDAILGVIELRPYLDRLVSELSFGMARALELAWLAARAPRVLLLDEPAAGLQQSEVTLLGSLIERVRGTAAVVLIDHDVPFVAGFARRLVAMDLGRVVADGAPDEVLNSPAVVESYLGAGSRA